MREDLEKKIFDTYPDLYKEKDLSAQNTCMCWGLCIGDGWYTIIDNLSKKITEYCKKNKCIILATQVKEKFGTLRFYTNFSNDDIDRMIMEAENLSAKTCEICGDTKTAKLRGTGWVRTLCNKCSNMSAK